MRAAPPLCHRWLLPLCRWCARLPAAAMLAVLAMLAATPPVLAADAMPLERSVKAAFLYKFLGYVEYPADRPEGGAPYVVGVLGADDIAAELVRITAGRVVDSHPVMVRPLHAGDLPAGLHMLFVGGDGASAALLQAAQQAGVLTVTDTPGGLRAGSVINFVLADERVRFEVSLEAAEKSNLKVSSRLLSVAYVVRKAGL
jgi:hypothetical protein